MLRGDHQVKEQVLVFGFDVIGVAGLGQGAYHVGEAAGEDTNHPAFLAAAPAALNPHHHPVAVPGFFQVGGHQVDVLAAGLRGDEAEAVGVDGELPRHQVHFLGQTKAATLKRHQLSPSYQLLQHCGHGPGLVLAGVEQPEHLLHQQRPGGFLEGPQDAVFLGSRLLFAPSSRRHFRLTTRAVKGLGC